MHVLQRLSLLVLIISGSLFASNEQVKPMSHPSQFTGIQPQTIDLGGLWQFRVDPEGVGEQEEWYASSFDDSGWFSVTVPHTWNVLPDYADYDGLAWYRRTFPIDKALSEAHFRLEFDAVFYKAHVWLNGIELGEHAGGYTAFFFDITLRTDTDNVLVVQVDNRRSPDRIPASQPGGWSFDWWNYGGIVRDVRLLATNPIFIERQMITAAPDLVDSADIQSRTRIVNSLNTAATVYLTISILDEATGAVVWADPTLIKEVQLPPQETSEIELATTLPNPKLWHFDHPDLYVLVAELHDQEGYLLHQTETTFGIRKIEIRDARFYLNGEWVRLVGLSRHADSPEYGLAENVSIMASDYDDLKRLNMVFSRPVHYPQHDFILDYCDHNGILLIPEVPAWQLSAAQMSSESMRDLEKQQLREMIEHDFNHPSVWAWSLGNEIESETAQGHHFVQEMITYIKSVDPSRYVSFASNRLGSQPERDAAQYADFVMMNQYFGTWVGPKQGLGPALDAIHEAWPDKLVIISEFGFEPRWNRLWGPDTASLTGDSYYFVTDADLDDPIAIDRERQKLIREQMDVLRERPYVGGAIFWTYQDYRTPSGFAMGIVNMNREQSEAYDVLREEFAPALFQRIENNTELDQQMTTEVTIRSRGPLEEQMPAYTLQGYSLRWQVLAGDQQTVLQSGEVALPTLAPGETWETEIHWTLPEDPLLSLHLSIVRPTGFVSLEKVINSDLVEMNGEE